jgi:hypothetical protein
VHRRKKTNQPPKFGRVPQIFRSPRTMNPDPAVPAQKSPRAHARAHDTLRVHTADKTQNTDFCTLARNQPKGGRKPAPPEKGRFFGPAGPRPPLSKAD